MNFLTAFGFAADVCGFASMLKSRLRKTDSDWNAFLAFVRKVVKETCNDYQDFLEISHDHKDIVFPDKYEELLYENVVQSLENDTAFEYTSVLPSGYDFPKGEKERIYGLLKERLNYSFEYAMRSSMDNVKTQLEALNTGSNVSLSLLRNIRASICDIKPMIRQIYSAVTKAETDMEFFYELAFAHSQECYDIMRSSRFRYIEIDEHLFADTKKKEFDVIVKKETYGNSKTIIETVHTQKGNFVFVGEGGTGKTVSLLQIWADWLNRKEELPVYVPLNEYDGTADNFIDAYIGRHYDIDLDNATMQIILLLDGFNEITSNADKVLREIKNIGANHKVRIALTSRHSFINLYGLDGFNTYDIQPLSSDSILTFLEKANLTAMDNWETLLSTPMMVTLYANTCAVQKNDEDVGLFPFKHPHSKGEIIYNYFICQLAKLATLEQKENLYSAYIALFGVAPYIAWYAETNGAFSVEGKDCRRLISEYLSTHGDFIREQAYKFLEEISFWLHFELNDTIKPLDALVHTFCILAAEATGDGSFKYSFQHQHFRDFLSALHVDNAISKALAIKDGFVVPNEIKAHILSAYISEMLGGYYEDYRNLEKFEHRTRLHVLMDFLRGMKHKDAGYAVNNIIAIWRKERGNRIVGENLSRLDLSHVPLNGIVFSNHLGATIFDESIISDVTFLPQGHTNSVGQVIYSLDGQRIFTMCADGLIKEWNIETGECLKTRKYASSFGDRMVLCSDAQRAILITRGITKDNIEEIDIEIGNCLRLFEHESERVKTVDYSPDDEWVLALFSNGIIREWSRDTGECVNSIESDPNIANRAIYTYDGKNILLISQDGIITEINKNTGNHLCVFKNEFESLSSATLMPWEFTLHSRSPNGKWVISVSSEDGIIREWDMKTKECMRKFNTKLKSVSSVSYNSDGMRLLLSSISPTWDWIISEFDKNTGVCLRVLPVGRVNTVDHETYSSDGKRILFISYDNSINEWDRLADRCIKKFEGHSETIQSAIYSPDGSRILSASADHTIKEWDRKTGECIRTFEGHTYSVNHVAYSKDGNRILSISGDTTTREWDRNTGECLHIYKKDSIEPYSEAYIENTQISSFKKRNLSTSVGGIVNEWDKHGTKVLWSMKMIPGLFIVGCEFIGCCFSSSELSRVIHQYGGRVSR